jgi:hypothetical protein
MELSYLAKTWTGFGAVIGRYPLMHGVAVMGLYRLRFLGHRIEAYAA